MKDVDWQELRLFLDVAETGSLAGAAQRTGLSAPTIGRRMVSLEKALGRKLFTRHQTGYELAADGHVLLEKVRQMHDSADDIWQWSSGAYQLPYVTISAGSWTSRFLAQNLSELWRPEDKFRLCFKTTEGRLDIGHREADIGIRNVRPQSGNLAVKQGASVAFAPYCHRDFDTERFDNWVSMGREASTTPSSFWVHSQPDLWITMWVNSPFILLEALKNGGGKGVLPCFVGDREPTLRRAGPIVEELTHTTWIVMHDDERHIAAKREVIDRLTRLVKSKSELFAGMETINEKR